MQHDSCHPETCEDNPMNNSRSSRNGFANQGSTCSGCAWFFTKKSFLKTETRTSTPDEFKAKFLALGR